MNLKNLDLKFYEIVHVIFYFKLLNIHVLNNFL